MKSFKFFQTISCIALITGLAPFGWGASHSPAQASASSAARAASSTAAMASTRGAAAQIKNGTKISARLISNIDVRKAKPGDKVVARVTKNVKQHGKLVVRKGDKLVGHVTSVQTAANGKVGSALGVKFDQLVAGRSTARLNTVLTSILSVPGSSNGPEPIEAPAMPAPVAAPVGGGGGGLLGGVGGAVGSTVGAVGGIGGAVGATTQSTLGANSALNLSTPARQIHLQTQASADQSTQMNSVLRTRKGNLRLQSGTRMRFRVAANGSARTE